MKYQECKVVMLPTKDKGWLQRDLIKSLHLSPLLEIAKYNSLVDSMRRVDRWQAQHLYFTSDEPIKEEGWFINNYSKVNGIEKARNSDIKRPPLGYCFRKIVASTDSSLGLPVIPESFIRKYVTANGKIDKVKLERLYHKGNYPSAYGNVEQWGKSYEYYTLAITTNNEVVVIDDQFDIVNEIPIPDEAKQAVDQYFKQDALDNPLEDKAYKLWKEYCKRYPILNINSGMFINIFEEGAEWKEKQNSGKVWSDEDMWRVFMKGIKIGDGYNVEQLVKIWINWIDIESADNPSRFPIPITMIEEYRKSKLKESK